MKKNKELEEKNAEQDREIKVLRKELREKELCLSAYESLPENWGYIKDKNGKYIDIFGRSFYFLDIQKKNDYLGKDDLQILNEHNQENAKKVIYIVDHESHFKASSFFLKVELDNHNQFNFYHKENQDEEWSVYAVAVNNFAMNDIFCGFTLYSESRQESLEVEFNSVRFWKESGKAANWQSHLFYPHKTEGIFKEQDNQLSLTSKGAFDYEGFYVYQKTKGLFSFSCCVKAYNSSSTTTQLSFGIMLRDSLEPKSNSIKFVYDPRIHSLILRRGRILDFHKEEYLKFLENYKQDQDVLYTKKAFMEFLPWIKVVKSPFWDVDGNFAGLIASFTGTYFRQLIDNCLSDAVIVFNPEGLIKLYNKQAGKVLAYTSQSDELADQNIITLYGDKRAYTEDFQQIIYHLRMEADNMTIRGPVQFKSPNGKVFYFQEYYESFLNVYSGMIDRIVLVLSAVSADAVRTMVNHDENSVDHRIKLIRNFLLENYGDDFSIIEMVKTLGINYSTIKQHYKNQTGKTINQDLLDIRLQESARLLVQTKMSILEIAIECGFNSHRYFSKKFKECFGMSPSAYRIKNI